MAEDEASTSKCLPRINQNADELDSNYFETESEAGEKQQANIERLFELKKFNYFFAKNLRLLLLNSTQNKFTGNRAMILHIRSHSHWSASESRINMNMSTR